MSLSRVPLMAWLVGALAVLGMLLGYGSFPGSSRAPGPVDEEAWTLGAPRALRSYDEGDYQSVRSWAAWGGASDYALTQGAEAAKPQWRLVALVSEPSPRAIVRIEGQNSYQRLAVDETLPDGGRIIAVAPDHVVAVYDGCHRIFALYAMVKPGDAASKLCTPIAGLPHKE